MLHKRQIALLDAIDQFWAKHGYGPTIRELGDLCGIPSGSSVEYHLRSLELLGLIARERERARTIRRAS